MLDGFVQLSPSAVDSRTGCAALEGSAEIIGTQRFAALSLGKLLQGMLECFTCVLDFGVCRVSAR